MYVVNFIKSNNVEAAKQKWENIANNFVTQPGILSTHFYEVSGGAKEENPVDFQFVSIVECQDQTQYETAKKKVFSQPENKLKSEDKTFVIEKEAFTDIYHKDGALRFDSKKAMLISPVTVSNDQIDAFWEHWIAACEIMVKKEGFRGVNFLKALDPQTSEVKFINVAEWESHEHLKTALTSDGYKGQRENAMKFKGKLAPALCKHINTIQPESRSSLGFAKY